MRRITLFFIPSEDGRPKSSNWVQASTSRSASHSLVHRMGRGGGLHGELFEGNDILSIDEDIEDLEDIVAVQGTEKGDTDAL